MRAITLTTDFGADDWFVGAMKAVILGIHPRASVVDLTHGIAPGDLRAGAFALMAGCRYFPKGTVHVAVVDPGVGGPRRAIAARTANGFFVGPDNGVLSWALRLEKIETIRLLENRDYFLDPVSRTFHGRDIFAPVAAHLSRGLPVRRLGRELEDYVRLPWPQATKRPGQVRGEVVHLDRFGNAITNIQAELLSGQTAGGCEISFGSRPVGHPVAERRAARAEAAQASRPLPLASRPSVPAAGLRTPATTGPMAWRKARCPLAEFYGAVPLEHPVAVLGSSGLLEIAVNGGSAARSFGLRIGDRVTVRLAGLTAAPGVATLAP